MQQTGCSALLATHYKINPMPDGLLLILFLGALVCGGWAKYMGDQGLTRYTTASSYSPFVK